MRIGMVVVGAVLVGFTVVLALQGPAERIAVVAEPVVEIEVPTPPGKAGKGSACHTGCSLKSHPLPSFTLTHFNKALAEYGHTPHDAPVQPALERLIFYAEHTRTLLRKHGHGSLSPAQRQRLDRELSRRALVAIRIVDAAGAVRADLPWTRVPFGVKQHLHPRTRAIQEMSFNGTVMRTGLGHIWARY
jgi:hypothetical protein